jgi:shikimate dehydrogenase
MKTYGLIGYPLLGTFSPAYFKAKFAALQLPYQYEAYPMADLTGLRAFVEARPTLCGLNVTIPHKEAVLPLLDALDADAAAVGAVNTIRIERKGAAVFMKGYNTDLIGFAETLLPFLGDARPAALVLGTGGASKAVQQVLRAAGMAFQLVSRRAQAGVLAYADISPAVLQQHLLVINTTPLGMFPDRVGMRPDLPYEALGPQHLLYDLVYNPRETAFMLAGKARGCRVMGGLGMLEAQADAAWALWEDE